MSRETRVLDPSEVKFLDTGNGDISNPAIRGFVERSRNLVGMVHSGMFKGKVPMVRPDGVQIFTISSILANTNLRCGTALHNRLVDDENASELSECEESDDTECEMEPVADEKLENLTPEQISELVTSLHIEEAEQSADDSLLDKSDDKKNLEVKEIKNKLKTTPTKQKGKPTQKAANKQIKNKAVKAETDSKNVEEQKAKGRKTKAAPVKEVDGLVDSSQNKDDKEIKPKKGKNIVKHPEETKGKKNDPPVGKEEAKPLQPAKKTKGSGKQNESDEQLASSKDTKSGNSKPKKANSIKEENISESSKSVKNKTNKIEKTSDQDKDKDGVKSKQVKSKKVDNAENKEPESKIASQKPEKPSKGKPTNTTSEKKENKEPKNNEKSSKDALIETEPANQRPKRNIKKANYGDENKEETKAKKEVKAKKPLQDQGNVPQETSKGPAKGKAKTEPKSLKSRTEKQN